MQLHGQYYLHSESHDLIYKSHGGVDETSDFVVRCWSVETIGATPERFLNWLKEAKSLGASDSAIKRLVEHNTLDEWILDCRDQLGLDTP
jgi:hypothetical protein